MVELRSRLVVLWCPSRAAINSNRHAAIIRLNHAFGIGGVNPQSVVISVGDGQRVEDSSAIRGTKKAEIEQIDGILVLRICIDVILVPGSHPQGIVVHHLPVRAPVVGAIQRVFLRFDHRVDTIGIRF